MSDARTVVRILAVLVLAVLVGMGFMLKKMAGQGGRNPALAGFQNRIPNDDAWKAFDSLTQPDFRQVLSQACQWNPPGLECTRILLPTDELGKVLAAFRSPERRKEAGAEDPTKAWLQNLPAQDATVLSERVSPQTTLGDFLVVWNQISKERQDRRTADSLSRVPPPPPAPLPPPPTETAPASSSNPPLL